MKQHITNHQLCELSDSAREKLDTWIKSRASLGHRYITAEYNVGCYQCGTSFALSVGEMIELLGDSWFLKTGSFTVTRRESVYPDQYEGNDSLCDSLWFAVKRELEKDDSHD